MPLDNIRDAPAPMLLYTYLKEEPICNHKRGAIVYYKGMGRPEPQMS